MRRIYLDYNATTPVDPEVREAMLPYLSENFGNPSSIHWAGQEARKGLDGARGRVARIFNASSDEIYFTSGGTESANLAIKGVLYGKDCPHVIASPLEHHSVLEPLQTMERLGEIAVTWLAVDRAGRVDPQEVEKSVRPETRLIAVMYANNETGNIYPISEVGKIARGHRIPFFCDAVQAVGKLPIDLQLLPVDLLSFSAHKFGGPKGVGGLYVRRGVQFAPILEGGGQEGKRRGGTENLPGIIGLAVVLERVYRDLVPETDRIRRLRDALEEAVLAIPGVRLHGDRTDRLANTLNFGLEGIESEILLVALDREGVAASNGAACTSGTLEPSHVLQAMGYSTREARGGIRFSLGKGTTESEVEEVSRLLPQIVRRLR